MNLPRFRRRLLAWFDQHQRVLPWRGDRNPYHIWVSEVMLQQTTVAAVVPYYQRFIKKFPTVESLAEADEQQVLHLWQGLGYYRRARHLHQAAKMVMSSGGQLPNDPAMWRELAGVGRYILGAILSQAFDRPMPIVEANSLRVLCRLFGRRGDTKSTVMQRWLWQTAEKILPGKRCGDFNQAMMELGSLICTPTAPRCHECPVQTDCQALADGTQSRIPLPAKAKQIEHVREVAVVLRKGARVLLAQRPADADRWPSMWEFPQLVVIGDEPIDRTARRCAKERLGITAKIKDELTTVRYTVTRFRITLTAMAATFRTGSPNKRHYQKLLWLLPNQLHEYPASTAQRGIMECVVETR